MRHMVLAIVRRKLGDRAGATKEFEALKEPGPLVSYQVASVLAQWGDIEGAIRALVGAVEARDAGLLDAKMDPLLIPLRGDPRYTAVLRRVGLV
jgi:hypothetical protein